MLILGCATSAFVCSMCISSRALFSLKTNFKSKSSSLRAVPTSQDCVPLIDALAEVIPPLKERFFFPGHCGGDHAPKSMKKLYGSELFSLDLPELDGLDNIHCPEGPLLQALQLASAVFGSSRSWFLVNGSTSGILSAILAVVQIHQHRQLLNRKSTTIGQGVENSQSSVHRSIMILGRDSHKASFDGLRLADCDGALLPCVQDQEFGISLGVNLDSISEALDLYGSQVCGVLLTRPSYQGVLCSSDRLREIVKLCHSRGVPVVVDEAHGSHLRFLGRPHLLDAIECGADIVIQSSHKTLSALSQAAMMHLGINAFSFNGQVDPVSNKKDIGGDYHVESSTASKDVHLDTNRNTNTGVDEGTEDRETTAAGDVLHDCFSMLTTTSPNTVLLVSLDATRAQMASDGINLVQSAATAADEIRQEIRLQSLHISEKQEGKQEYSARGVRGVQLLDDSIAVTAGKRHIKGLESESMVPPTESHLWYVDPLRLTVRFPGQSALDVDDKMCEEKGIFCELNLQKCVTYAIPLGSTSRSLKILRKSLLAEGEVEIEAVAEDTSIPVTSSKQCAESSVTYLHTDKAKSGESVAIRLLTQFDMTAAVGRISAETICPYPPGIPVLIKGERVTAYHVGRLVELQRDQEKEGAGRKNSLGSGCTVTGCADKTLHTIRVLAL